MRHRSASNEFAMRMTRQLLLLGLVCLAFSNEESEEGIHFTNSWAVHLGDSDLEAVNEIATRHGFTNQGQIGSLLGYYHFIKRSLGDRSRRSLDDHTERLRAEPKVTWVEQQRILERSKRHTIPSEDELVARTIRRLRRDTAVTIRDPYYKDQWYLQNVGQSSGPAGIDINVLPVWARGYSGKGIVVSILDDGVDHTHPDLTRNYDPDASFDFNDFDADPRPRSEDPQNCHGTKCAGEVAAEANNGICGVGVSFNASIGGIRMLDGKATDTIEGSSLSYRSDYIDIYSCCWGPKDDGKRFGKPGVLAGKALKIGAERGRGGKGNIFVWATGNGGLTDDDCNCDGYTTSIYTVSIGAISDHGLSTYYTETCASTLAVTFSGGSHREADENSIVTTELNHKCTEVFKGTSSAAPLAAGMLALVLEANPNLTWRDVQHLIVETSQKTSPLDEGWKINGAGKAYNHKFGFGRMDVMRLVERAVKWNNVAKQRVCHSTEHNTTRNIPASGSLILAANTSACTATGSEIGKLEHVQVVVSLQHRHRGDLSMTLISPSGTRSELLTTRRNDHSTGGLQKWVFMTVHCWGEDPEGSWTLIITDNDRNTREHHMKNAKQGDFEDVTRVVMDDTEKPGPWDIHKINEYDQIIPGSKHSKDHILKSLEDTTGELVKGNKFANLAKRKKNRGHSRGKYLKPNFSHQHSVDSTLMGIRWKKKHKHKHWIKKFVSKKKKHKKWSNVKKHGNKHYINKKRKLKHSKWIKTYHGKHKAVSHHRDTALHSANFGSKVKVRNNKGSHHAGTTTTGEFAGLNAALEIEAKRAQEDNAQNIPAIAEGSLEIPKEASLEARIAIQALANPSIAKVFGIDAEDASKMMLQRLNRTFTGEVDIQMHINRQMDHNTKDESSDKKPEAAKNTHIERSKGNVTASDRDASNDTKTLLETNTTHLALIQGKAQSFRIEIPKNTTNLIKPTNITISRENSNTFNFSGSLNNSNIVLSLDGDVKNTTFSSANSSKNETFLGINDTKAGKTQVNQADSSSITAPADKELGLDKTNTILNQSSDISSGDKKPQDDKNAVNDGTADEQSSLASGFDMSGAGSGSNARFGSGAAVLGGSANDTGGRIQLKTGSLQKTGTTESMIAVVRPEDTNHRGSGSSSGDSNGSGSGWRIVDCNVNENAKECQRIVVDMNNQLVESRGNSDDIINKQTENNDDDISNKQTENNNDDISNKQTENNDDDISNKQTENNNDDISNKQTENNDDDEVSNKQTENDDDDDNDGLLNDGSDDASNNESNDVRKDTDDDNNDVVSVPAGLSLADSVLLRDTQNLLGKSEFIDWDVLCKLAPESAAKFFSDRPCPSSDGDVSLRDPYRVFYRNLSIGEDQDGPTGSIGGPDQSPSDESTNTRDGKLKYKEPNRNKDIAVLEDALEEQMSHLADTPSQEQSNGELLRRVKQDIQNGDVKDLEILESQIRDGMSNPTSSSKDDSTTYSSNNKDRIYKDRQSDGSGDTYYDVEKRRLSRSAPTERARDEQANYGEGNSGILESWSLVLYGTK